MIPILQQRSPRYTRNLPNLQSINVNLCHHALPFYTTPKSILHPLSILSPEPPVQFHFILLRTSNRWCVLINTSAFSFLSVTEFCRVIIFPRNKIAYLQAFTLHSPKPIFTNEAKNERNKFLHQNCLHKGKPAANRDDGHINEAGRRKTVPNPKLC